MQLAHKRFGMRNGRTQELYRIRLPLTLARMRNKFHKYLSVFSIRSATRYIKRGGQAEKLHLYRV
jgi:hypothetical protein